MEDFERYADRTRKLIAKIGRMKRFEAVKHLRKNGYTISKAVCICNEMGFPYGNSELHKEKLDILESGGKND